MFKKILMVCIGNICRSPMAEWLLREQSSAITTPITVQSAGIGALIGHPADPNVLALLHQSNIDCSPHRARQIEPKMISEADLILVMEDYHRKAVEQLVPSACGKVHLLGKWGQFEIADPYRQPPHYFKETERMILQGIAQWRQKIWT
jgi:protein-tyrosine phosphatase